MWIKWVVFGYLILVALVAIYQASKGEHEVTFTPGAQAVTAVIATLLAIGVLAWL